MYSHFTMAKRSVPGCWRGSPGGLDSDPKTFERNAEPNASRNSHPPHRLRMVRRSRTSDWLPTRPSRWPCVSSAFASRGISMTTIKRAAIVALVIELVCGGILYLGERDYLGWLHLDFLALAAMLLHLGGVVITIGRWADGLNPAAFSGILFVVQWLVWTVIVYAFLLVQEYCRHRKTSAWMKLCAGAAVLSFAVLLVSQWDWPPSISHATDSPRAPKGVAVQSIRGDGLDADFFHGTSDKPQKAVIVLGGSEGGKSWSDCTEFIEELVDQGCCVLSLAYFGTDDLPTQLRCIPLEYFSNAFDWLATQKELVIPNDYAVIGGSRGAELALLLGSRHPEIKAVVAIAPSSVVFAGPPTGKLDAMQGQHSAWSFNGRELAFLPALYSWTTLRGLITGRQTRMIETALRNSRRVEDAVIPVQRIQGPILLVSFTRDEVWPSTLMSEQIMEHLRGSGYRFSYEHASYDAGHCEWGIEACRTNMLRFLRERFLAPAAGHRNYGTADEPDGEQDAPANAGRAPRVSPDASGPAWLRFPFCALTAERQRGIVTP